MIKSRRDSSEIVANILEVLVERPRIHTKLLTKTGLSHERLKVYLKNLRTKKLIQHQGNLYCITDKGLAMHFATKDYEQKIEALT